ncbi:hypothetical protein B566_EDAN001803 [Ephemera danica]|nr:hypothetical protein B566_EDAN001803 [Ephemera danica]
MAKIRYKKYRIFAVLVLAITFYFLFRSRKLKYHFEFDVAQANPASVWEYVADFSNMKYLNPTILDFTIESESGNYDHWEYSAHYTEFLSQIPMVKNTARANFVVRPEGDEFVIISHHLTCFLSASFACVTSDSEYRFRAITAGSVAVGTRCLEKINYECPTALRWFCTRELEHQRQAIRENLRKHFANKKTINANV